MAKSGIMIKIFVMFQIFMCCFSFAADKNESIDEQGKKILSGVWEKLCYTELHNYVNVKLVIQDSGFVFIWKAYSDDKCTQEIEDEGWSAWHFNLSKAELDPIYSNEVRREGQHLFAMDGLVLDGPHWQCEGIVDFIGVEEVPGGGKHFYFGRSLINDGVCFGSGLRPVKLDRRTGPFVYKGPFNQSLREFVYQLPRSRQNESAKERAERIEKENLELYNRRLTYYKDED